MHLAAFILLIVSRLNDLATTAHQSEKNKLTDRPLKEKLASALMTRVGKERGFKSFIKVFFKNNDLQVLPVVVLVVYTCILLDSIRSNKVCPQEVRHKIQFLQWMHIEHALYLSNILGISLFLSVKVLMSRCRRELKFTMQD
jgi:hypothetical protein